MLAELLQEQRVLALLCVLGKQRRERLAQLGELVLGVWVEDVQRGQVDGLGGVGLVGDGDGLARALVGEGEVAKELFGLGAGAVDFLLAESDAALLLGLVFVAVKVARFPAQAVGFPVLLDALCLALLVRFGLGLGFGLCISRLLCLFALDLRVLGGVP